MLLSLTGFRAQKVLPIMRRLLLSALTTFNLLFIYDMVIYFCIEAEHNYREIITMPWICPWVRRLLLSENVWY
jgi:hypothetical protein